MLKIIKGDFDTKVLNSKKVVLVDFFATWCGPCQMLSPILEKIASEHNEFDIVSVDVDENSALAQEYKIMYVPTLIIFKDGKVLSTLNGLLSENEILEEIKKHL